MPNTRQRARTVVVFVEPLRGDLRATFHRTTRTITGPVADDIRAQLGDATLGALHFYRSEQPIKSRLVAIGTAGGGALLVSGERDTTPKTASAPMCDAFASWLGLEAGDARYVSVEVSA